MGQEASLPQDPSFDGQSQTGPSQNGNGGFPQNDGSNRPGQAIRNMFQRSAPESSEYADKESARAAAELGHFDFAMSPEARGPPPQYQYQQQARASEQQQQYTQQQQMPQQHSQRPPPPPPEHSASPPPYATVGVMFSQEPATNRTRGKGRGKRLINSMRNLSLGQRGGAGAVPEPDTSVTTSAAAPQASVNEWERQWDDDDESDEEEDDLLSSAGMHPPLRPGMDEGHSVASLEQPYADVRVDNLKAPPEAARVDEGPLVQMNGPSSMQRQESDTLEWDTGVQEEVRTEKPNIEMFLPMLRVLGKGSFGKVVLVQKNRGHDLGALFAMKILKKEYLKRRRQIERTQTERRVLSVVNHPFIMKMHYAFQSEDKLFFVLDYCAGGELFFHLSRFRRFPERVARFYTAELLLAIGHLHKRHIIYRDLKPENVLIDADGHVKLGDFGLAKTHIHDPCEGAYSMCGTPEYMAPEVLLQTGHGFCVDYWGLGMLVYEMMTGLPPWYTTDRAKLFRRLKSAPLEIPTYFSEQCASCVSALLERSPRRRLGYRGCRHVMEHDFFRSINFRALYAKRVDPPIRPCDGWNAEEALVTISSPNGEADARQALDKATSNFDPQFTTMPVDLDDDTADGYEDDEEGEDLHANTFLGFTYDDAEFQSYAAASPARERTQQGGYHQNG